VSARLNTIGRIQGLTDTFYAASSNRILSVLLEGAVSMYFFVMSTDKTLEVKRDHQEKGENNDL